MTSLNYTAQHRIWQQRLAKEARDAYRLHQYSPRSSQSARLLSSQDSPMILPSNPNLLRDEPFHHSASKHSVIAETTAWGRSDSYLSSGLRSTLSKSNWSTRPIFQYRGPAEVRGKYARPASLIEIPEPLDIPHTGNPLLVRPTTSGSLVRKRSFQYTAPILQSQEVQTKPQTPSSYRSAMRTSKGRRPLATAATHRRSSEPLPTFPAPDLQEQSPATAEPSQQAPQAESGKAEGETEEMKLEEALAEQVESGRPPTAATWKTTSSQRRYIDELENLLREERKVLSTQRRILAEAKLSSLESPIR